MQKRSYTAEFKTKIVLEVLRGERELNEIAAEYEIAPNQIRNWKAEFVENATVVFDKKRDQRIKDELAKTKNFAAVSPIWKPEPCALSRN